MTVLFDTNVVLDVLLKRPPYAPAVVALFAAVERGELNGVISATTVTTIFYLARKGVGRERALEEIRRLLKLFTIATVNRAVIEDAIGLRFSDFEDAVLHEAARHAGAEGIVTRNIADFDRASLHIYSPDDLLRMLLIVS